ncbi:N-acetylglucosamine-6-phosphate deacetylase [Olivibacter sp. SDN3]|uniref:N-acetylglucosamine-6-phosphate deacetylase n=1 Tax=Olivibacter sp. SDN3 TaxID=2764720 RepID=UPI0016519F68|nr:N-acetylglucosamine-6-phosphate deacetylase [Olivibacter sp. SDN3]QNL49293.1 N-acetylglucosamine-6-phosphate deacetylase [Olivibacter sp. SDN3]
MTEQTIKIYNGKLIGINRIIEHAVIVLRNGKIDMIAQGDITIPDAITINAQGKYITAGFIDIHVHGGGGADFMDGNVEAFLKVAETHAKYGTTAMVPTTLTSDKAHLLETLRIYDEAHLQNTNGASFLGLHIEGPYFSMNQRGAQDPRYIRDPDPKEYKEILHASDAIVRWSVAPEKKGAIAFGRYLRQHGVIPSIAHTDAIYEEVIEAFENGYNLATHLYSAMSGVTRKDAFRYAGVIESAFIIDEMDVEIIADGIHLPAPLLKLVYKIKGPDKIALITDAMRGAAMPAGPSMLGNIKNGLPVIIEDDVAKLPDRSSFAGSVATTNRLIRTMVQLADISLTEAIKMLTYTPARIMGVTDKKGSLAVGKDADIVILDQDFNVHQTIIKGKIVYDSAQS